MKLLLDTNVLIWLFEGTRKISAPVRNVVSDSGNTLFVSVVSGWEYGQKRLLRPQELRVTFDRTIAGLPHQQLDLEFAIHPYAESLPLIHRDPFDRLLIAQALHHDLVLVSSNETIRRYPVKTLW